MQDTFDNFFSALQKSEEMAYNKRKQSKEVKEAIQKIKVKINAQRSSMQEGNTKKNSLEVSLAETTVGLKILQMTEKGLTCDLDEIRKELQHEENRYQELTSCLASMCQENSDKVISFSKEYGLTSLGWEKRESLAQEKISALKTEAVALKSGIENLTEHMKTLQASLNLRSQLMMKVNDLEQSIASEDKNLRNQTSNLIVLRQRNKELVDEPGNGEEFINNAKRRQEYDTDTDELQSKVKDYQNELKTLTEQLKRKERQELQSQYRCWQRQRQQQSEAGKEICHASDESVNAFQFNPPHEDVIEIGSNLNNTMDKESESSDFIMISSFEESGK